MARLPDVRADLQRAIATLAGAGDVGILRIAEALKLWSESDCPLEVALGVAKTWRVAERRRRRDAIYGMIAETYFSKLSGMPLARTVVVAVNRYETSAWRHDRACGRRPNGVNALAFDLLSIGVCRLDTEALKKLLAGKNHTGEYPARPVDFKKLANAGEKNGA